MDVGDAEWQWQRRRLPALVTGEQSSLSLAEQLSQRHVDEHQHQQQLQQQQEQLQHMLLLEEPQLRNTSLEHAGGLGAQVQPQGQALGGASALQGQLLLREQLMRARIDSLAVAEAARVTGVALHTAAQGSLQNSLLPAQQLGDSDRLSGDRLSPLSASMQPLHSLGPTAEGNPPLFP